MITLIVTSAVATALSVASLILALTGGYAAGETEHRHLNAKEVWAALFALKAAAITSVAAAAAWAVFGLCLGAP